VNDKAHQLWQSCGPWRSCPAGAYDFRCSSWLVWSVCFAKWTENAFALRGNYLSGTIEVAVELLSPSQPASQNPAALFRIAAPRRVPAVTQKQYPFLKCEIDPKPFSTVINRFLKLNRIVFIKKLRKPTGFHGFVIHAHPTALDRDYTWPTGLSNKHRALPSSPHSIASAQLALRHGWWVHARRNRMVRRFFIAGGIFSRGFRSAAHRKVGRSHPATVAPNNQRPRSPRRRLHFANAGPRAVPRTLSRSAGNVEKSGPPARADLLFSPSACFVPANRTAR
jgi:hypothetical protein